MDKEKIKQSINELKKLNYEEWKKVKEIVSKYYEIQKEKLVKDKTIYDEELLEQILKQYFIQ